MVYWRERTLDLKRSEMASLMALLLNSTVALGKAPQVSGLQYLLWIESIRWDHLYIFIILSFHSLFVMLEYICFFKNYFLETWISVYLNTIYWEPHYVTKQNSNINNNKTELVWLNQWQSIRAPPIMFPSPCHVSLVAV